MDREKIKILIKEQRAYFSTGATREEAYRIQALRRLRAWILKNQAEIEDALKKDLGKSRTESDMCEIGMVLEEIRFMLAHIHKWMAAKTVPSPLALFPARSFIKPSPRGVVLIMSPWNYPFLLTVGPFVDALAANMAALCAASDEQRTEMGRRAFAYYETHYRRRAVLDRLEEFILRGNQE